MRIFTRRLPVTERIANTLGDWLYVNCWRWEKLDYIELSAEDYSQLLSELDITKCDVHPNFVIVKLRYILEGWRAFVMRNVRIKIQKQPEGRPLMVPGDE